MPLLSSTGNLNTFTRGNKFFELSNHLGNVLAVIGDQRTAVDEGNNGTIDYYEAQVLSQNDYYPGGMQLPGRTYSSGNNSYRYSINGQEKEKELNENITSAEFWMYDSRIGRRWNPDPVYQHSPYSTFGNNPISFVDPDGADTINISRKTTFDKRQHRPASYSSGRMDNFPSKLIDPGNSGITVTGGINIVAAEGLDVFRFTDINATIDENGVETINSSTTTTLDIRGKYPAYRAGQSLKGFHNDYFALASMAPGWLLDYYANKNDNRGTNRTDVDWPTWKGTLEAKALQSTIPFANRLNQVANVAYAVFGTTSLISGVLSMGSKGVAYTTVGRWMSQAELKAMNTTGMIQQGAGGQTFVTTGGASSYMGAARGSVYVEFQVPTRSLLQGGKDGWFKMIGPDASKTMQYQLNKQGGSMLPRFKNLSGVLQTK
jgi:RHS repeat-associated protein